MKGEPGSILRLGSLEVDRNRYRATLNGHELELSRSELELLAVLVANHRRVASRAELSEAVGLAAQRSVDVLLVSLRQKLHTDFIRNIRNRGWIIEPTALGA